MKSPATKKMPHSAEDVELVAGMAAGNLDGLGVLYERYERDVRRVVYRLGVAQHDVDDLVQAVFLQALRSAAKFDGRTSARGWLLGIAAMSVRRYRRSVGRAFGHLARWASRPQASPVTPAETLEAAEAHGQLSEALACISSQKREVFLLVTAEGLSAEQVASALGIPVATVWTRLHYARQEIRRHLEGETT